MSASIVLPRNPLNHMELVKHVLFCGTRASAVGWLLSANLSAGTVLGASPQIKVLCVPCSNLDTVFLLKHVSVNWLKRPCSSFRIAIFFTAFELDLIRQLPLRDFVPACPDRREHKSRKLNSFSPTNLPELPTFVSHYFPW
jgi:hypothetical protein